MRRCLLSLIAFSSVLAAQISGIVPIPPRPAPPPQPPPVQDAPKPVTPQRIHIGCGLQAAYVGPVPEWFNFPDSLSDEQIASLEWTLSANPNDTCARGYLIAHGRGHVPQR